MKKALILSSGGVDSTTCIGMAINELGVENVSTVSIFYGQKHKKELKCAKKIAKYYNIPHYELNLKNIFKFSNCPLLKKSSRKIQHLSYAEQIKENSEGMVSTYVPFRNGLFLSTIASLAVSIYPNNEVDIYIGVHSDDSAGNAYADCSESFTKSMYEAINIGTYGKIRVIAPLVNITKKDVVKKGLELKVPYHLSWSCYEGGKYQCGTCGTCIDRKKAFEENGVKDPVKYKE